MEPLKNNDTQTKVHSNKSNDENMQMFQSSSDSPTQQESTNATALCVVCSIRNRALALVPCGHFSVCVPCGHSLVVCPICGTNINALVRIYE